jgi:hypothetical protein
MRRKYWREVEVGDGITSVPADPGNGRLWSGEVTAVRRRDDGIVCLTVDVHGRSLCADDLVYGFGAKGPVTYGLNYPADEATFQRVRYKGRIVWSGHRVEGPVTT